ncbi:unnamed protein product [Camellia sinensis]
MAMVSNLAAIQKVRVLQFFGVFTGAQSCVQKEGEREEEEEEKVKTTPTKSLKLRLPPRASAFVAFPPTYNVGRA